MQAWLAGFDLGARRADIDAIVARNAFMAELQQRIVPLIVRYEAFWTRYFYQCAPASLLGGLHACGSHDVVLCSRRGGHVKSRLAAALCSSMSLQCS